MIVVVDASVAVKWFFAPTPDEQDSEKAVLLMRRVIEGSLTLWQPPHFNAEVAAVLARLKPDQALQDTRDLLQLDIQTVDDDQTYAIATDLAIRLNHHLFDTLYHALALSESGATLVTADRRYYRKARHVGQIELLAEWSVAQP